MEVPAQPLLLFHSGLFIHWDIGFRTASSWLVVGDTPAGLKVVFTTEGGNYRPSTQMWEPEGVQNKSPTPSASGSLECSSGVAKTRFRKQFKWLLVLDSDSCTDLMLFSPHSSPIAREQTGRRGEDGWLL